MVGRLLLLFILVPLVDMLLLTQVGAAIGFWNTVALVIVTGMLGAWLSKREGARAWQRWQQALSQGKLPEDGVIGSVLLLVGSVLLITPGVLTDAVGLSLLIAPSRRFIARLLRPRLQSWFDNKTSGGQGSGFRFVSFGGGSPFGAGPFPGEPAHERGPRGEPLGVESIGTVGRRPIGASKPAAIRRPPRQVIDADFEVSDDDE